MRGIGAGERKRRWIRPGTAAGTCGDAHRRAGGRVTGWLTGRMAKRPSGQVVRRAGRPGAEPPNGGTARSGGAYGAVAVQRGSRHGEQQHRQRTPTARRAPAKALRAMRG
ncbi:hypothetical protein GCM10027570_12310 [Streptomonospora sediminis]